MDSPGTLNKKNTLLAHSIKILKNIYIYLKIDTSKKCYIIFPKKFFIFSQ